MQQLSLVLPARNPLLSAELLAALERGAVVLVPNRRVAHSVAYAYAQYSLASGKRVWATPQLYTLQAWLERLWTLRTESAREQVLLSTVQTRRAWQQIVEASPWAETLLAPSGAASAALRSFQLMMRWGIARDELGTFDATEAQALQAWIATLDDLFMSRGWLAPFALADHLILTDAIPAVEIAVVAADDLSPAEQKVCAVVVRKGGRVTRVLRQAISERRRTVAAVDADDELVKAAQWARTQLQAGATTVGVIVPNLERVAALVRRTFADVFSPGLRTLNHEAEQPAFALATAQPLGDYAIVQAALDMLELVAGSAPSTLAGGLLRSPFLADAITEADARALADARLRQEGRELFDLGALEHVADANACPRLSSGLRAARALVDHKGTRKASEWSDVFVQLWRCVGWPGERTATSDEQQTTAKLHEVLGDFGTLDELLKPLSYARAVHEFVQLVNNTQFEPQTGAAPVTVVDQDDAPGMHFDSIWICGMDASRWPPAAEPDAFIPLPLQIRAGLPEASAAGMRSKHYERFLDLSAAATEVVFSWARMDEDVELLPSPWIASLATSQAVTAPSGYRHTLFAARTLLDEITELSAPPVTQTRVRGGTRIAELSALCAFRAQAELRLQAAPLARVSPALNPLERGHLMHEVLSGFWTRVASRDGLRNLSHHTRREMIRELLDRLSGALLTGASAHRARLVAIELAVAEDKLMELLNLEAARSSFTVYRQPELKAERRIAGLDLQVRFDRIDELPDGRRVVIDYKTGSSASPTKWWGERPEQPQLPLYAVLESEQLAAVTFAQLGVGKVGFEGVAREEGILPGIAAYPGNGGVPPERMDWQRLIPYWRGVIERLFARYAGGDASVDPLPQACRYCHLSTLCRIHEIRALAAEEGDV
jgi:probable DNA repair protein